MEEENNTNTIAFVSHPEHLNYFLSDQKIESKKNIHLICMTPYTLYEASKHEFKYSPIEKFYDPKEFIKFTSEGFDSCEKLAGYIDSQLDRYFKNVCNKGYFSSKNFIYYLKRFYDSIIHYIIKIKSTVEKIQPRRVICYVDSRKDSYLGIDYEIGDIIFQVLCLLKQKYNYEIISNEIIQTQPEHISNNKGKKLNRKIKDLLINKLNIDLDFDASKKKSLLAQNILKQTLDSLKIELNKNKDSIIVGLGRNNTLAQLNKYIRGWEEQGGRIKKFEKNLQNLEKIDYKQNLFLQKFNINHSTLERFTDKIQKDSTFSRYFESNNINFLKITDQWLKKYFNFVFPLCVASGNIIEKKLIDNKISIFLTPSLYYVTDIAAVLACKRLGIKVCSVQHGGMGYLKAPILKYTDYFNINYSYVYGQGVSNFFQSEFKTKQNKNLADPIAVGNPFLKKLYDKCRSHESIKSKRIEKKVLYVDTHFVPDFFYYGWNCYPKIWYSKLQKKIVDIFKKYPDIKLYMKLYPTQFMENPIKHYTKEKKTENIIYLPNKSNMVKFQNDVDLIIIDFPTTSLLNALCTKKPIIVYYNPSYLKLSSDSIKLLEKRVELTNSEKDFLETIDKFCKKKRWKEISNPDDSFLTQYGIFDSKIQPKDRLLEHLQKLSFKLS